MELFLGMEGTGVFYLCPAKVKNSRSNRIKFCFILRGNFSKV